MPSSIRPTRDSQVRLRAAPEEVTLDDWGLRERPLTSALAMMLAGGASWVAAWATSNVTIGLIVAALLLIVLWRTWLPVRYQVNGTGITQTVLLWRRHLPWTSVAGYSPRNDGALVECGAEGAPAGAFLLPWGNRQEDVRALLEFYVLRQ